MRSSIDTGTKRPPWGRGRNVHPLDERHRSQLDDLNDVLRIARADDPVYVATRGWMLVGDLRWDMTAEWQRPTH